MATVTNRTGQRLVNYALDLENIARRLTLEGFRNEAADITKAANLCGDVGRALRNKLQQAKGE